MTASVGTGVVAILTVIASIASSQKLEIQPAQEVQILPVGKQLLLTCKLNVPDVNLISELQWRDNKNRLVEKSDHKMQNMQMYTENTPFEPGLALFITSLAEDMAGQYTCSANYANTESLKATVVIKTIYAISWIDAPEKQYPKINTDYTVKCKVEANPPPLVDWLKNGEQIPSEERYVVQSEGLLIKNVRESDDGTYSCRAAVISTGELDTRYIKVEVQIPPTIENIKPVEIIDGQTGSVECKGHGKPPPAYTWIKLRNQEDLSITNRFGVNKISGLLTINKIEEGDHGLYKCVVENNAGRAETTVQINVLVQPKIIELANITQSTDRQTVLICKTFGRPAPLVTFKKYGSQSNYISGPQPNDNRIIMEQRTNDDKGESVGMLTITKLRRSDDGLYECIATNKGGTARRNGHITVEFKPTFESTKHNPPVWSWRNKPGNLSCLAESIPNATIEWKLNDVRIVNNTNVFRIQGAGPQSFLIVSPGNEPRFYNKYRCIATNKLGRAELLVELKEATAPMPVQQAKLELITATTIKFGIVGPPSFDGLPVKAFTVRYKRPEDASWEYAMKKTWSVNSSYIVENLEPEGTYVFQFAARNDVGLSDWSATQTQTTSKRSAPNEPSILSKPEDGVVNSPYSDYFDLRWNVPVDNGEPIDYYDIKCCPVRRVNGRWSESDSKCNTEELSGAQTSEYRITELSTDTHYKIELRAHNAIGFSTPAELVVKTARGSDTAVYKSDEPTISSAAIVGIAIAAIILFLIIVDVSCYCFNRAGILMAICERAHQKPDDDEDPKLGRDEKEPLRPDMGHNPMINTTVMKNSSVEYDGRKVSAKTGEIIGKNSAV